MNAALIFMQMSTWNQKLGEFWAEVFKQVRLLPVWNVTENRQTLGMRLKKKNISHRSCLDHIQHSRTGSTWHFSKIIGQVFSVEQTEQSPNCEQLSALSFFRGNWQRKNGHTWDTPLTWGTPWFSLVASLTFHNSFSTCSPQLGHKPEIAWTNSSPHV